MNANKPRKPRRCQMYTAEINFPKAGVYYPRRRCDGVPAEFVTYGNDAVGFCSKWLCESCARPERTGRQGWVKKTEPETQP